MDHLSMSFPINGKSMRNKRHWVPAVTINAVDMVAVHGHDGPRRKVEDAADDGSDDEQPASAEAVYDGQDRARGDQENGVLDDGRCEGDVARLSSRVSMVHRRNRRADQDAAPVQPY